MMMMMMMMMMTRKLFNIDFIVPFHLVSLHNSMETSVSHFLFFLPYLFIKILTSIKKSCMVLFALHSTQVWNCYFLRRQHQLLMTGKFT